MNFIVKKYLSNFVEIDPSQTLASIFSGTVEMSNLKVKKEMFDTIDLPYLEVVYGFIGKLHVELTMPIFYKYPIRINIEKVFLYARQKNRKNK